MMDQGAYRWLVKYAHKHHWRVATFYELTDLIQDGWLCYMIVRRKYPNAVDPPHIMRLFQVTFINHVNDLSKYQSRMAALIVRSAEMDMVEETMNPRDAEPGDAYFIPKSAPWYVHAFLRLLCSPYGPERLRAPHRVRMSGVRELSHDKLCRLIGADPLTTPILPQALEDYFSSV